MGSVVLCQKRGDLVAELGERRKERKRGRKEGGKRERGN